VSPTVRCGLSALRPTFGRVSRYGGMVLSWSQDRVGPIVRTSEDAAMVFNAIHGVDEKDPSTVTMPFQFQRDVDLSALRVGVDEQAPAELVDKLKELGMNPVSIGARPTVAGVGGGGLNGEYGAAFDSYVQQKAKEIGLDLNALPASLPRGEKYGGGRTDESPMGPADWNPRFVSGRLDLGFEFLQTERRRYIMVREWAAFLKDLDLYIGSPMADIGSNAQTGHPSAVLPYKFDVPAVRRYPGAEQGDEPKLEAQPICGQIIGNLYNDDLILSVAHKFQTHDDTVSRHPAL
jgi:Asp-tRNA(Asn)/Glu-tRNA(Gln) amidotransferase A subunit family amidase